LGMLVLLNHIFIHLGDGVKIIHIGNIEQAFLNY
jgi:hypothetical protein